MLNQNNSILTGYEKLYLRTGLILLFILGPIQYLIGVRFMALINADHLTMQPVLFIFTYALVSGIVYYTVLKLHCKKYAKRINDSLGICSIGLFSFHAGILIVIRMTHIILVRVITRDPEYHLNWYY